MVSFTTPKIIFYNSNVFFLYKQGLSQGGGSFPLAPKASRSTNAKSGKLIKQETVTLNLIQGL